MSDVITDPQLSAFLHSNINNDFGLTIDIIANKCKTYSRFNRWLNQDVNLIKQVLNKVKANGVSPAFFAAYEKTEGYHSSWGWLNHTRKKGDPLTDADAVSKWIVSQSKNTTDNPAWVDYANYNDFVPSAIKTSGNADFKNMTSGSIGKIVIAGTAAATWEVYYPNGLLKTYNGVQNYGKPLTGMMQTILTWGGSLEGGEVNDPTDPPDPETPPFNVENLTSFFTNFGTNLKKEIEKKMTVNLYDYGNSQNFGNSFLKVDKTFSNMYKIKPTLNFATMIDSVLQNSMDNLGGILDSIVPNPEVPPIIVPPEEPDAEMFFPVKKDSPGINFWKRNNWSYGTLQKSMTYGDRPAGFHSGYDIGAGGITGNKVYAIRKCTITNIRTGGGSSGYTVEMQNLTDNYHILYLHLLPGSAVVSIGQTVEAGEQIAIMSNSGNSSMAIHLHIEVSPSGQFYNNANTIDPEPYLKINADNSSSLPSPN